MLLFTESFEKINNFFLKNIIYISDDRKVTTIFCEESLINRTKLFSFLGT